MKQSTPSNSPNHTDLAPDLAPDLASDRTSDRASDRADVAPGAETGLTQGLKSPRGLQRWGDWLERQWVAPAYGGWLLGGFTICFFAAATNTLAGWLYVMSGLCVALLAIAAVLPGRILRRVSVRRQPIVPVSAGDALEITLVIENATAQAKPLMQIQDCLPPSLGGPQRQVLEHLIAGGLYRWSYYLPVTRRGIYHWQEVWLRTAAPLGLFWCRRSHSAKAIAIVYPQVLPLIRCPLIDQLGARDSLQVQSNRLAQSATEGITRSLRPYRWGDPIRLIHWRTSARHGELRVRELERFTSGQELIIALDTSPTAWGDLTGDSRSTPGASVPEVDARGEHSVAFEQAVSAAASLYFYAVKQQLSVKLWTAGQGLIEGQQAVLEVLAGIQPGEKIRAARPDQPLLWLTADGASCGHLVAGSRWLCWLLTAQPDGPKAVMQDTTVGLMVAPGQALQARLQAAL